MPINSTTAYNNALSSTIKEEWIFELRNDTYTSGGSTQYIRLGTAEVGSGTTKYHSLITSLPSIRETIDLKASFVRSKKERATLMFFQASEALLKASSVKSSGFL
jgi:hypothetical protein